MRIVLLTLGLGLCALSAHGQDKPANQPVDRKEDESSTTNRSGRALGSAITGGFKYNPPAPEPEVKEEEKPKNEIVRLPTLTVQGSRPPIFSDKALREQRERGKFNVKKYLSEFDRGVLNSISGPAWSNFSNEKRAEQMAYDENRKQTMETIDQQSLMYEATGDERRAKDAQEDKYNTTMRSSDPLAPKDGSKWYGELR